MLLISMTWLGRERHRFCAKFSPIPQLYQSRGWGTWRWKIAPLGCNCLQFSAGRLELSSVSEVRFLFEIGGEWTDVRATLHQDGDKGGATTCMRDIGSLAGNLKQEPWSTNCSQSQFPWFKKKIRKKKLKEGFKEKNQLKSVVIHQPTCFWVLF